MGRLANRLKKTFRHQRKWARRQGLTCFRVYDHDIPEWPLSLDYLDGHGALRPGRGLEEERLGEVVDEVREGIELKTLSLQGHHTAVTELTIEEWGAEFLLKLGPYRDYGLFLDHRETRQRVKKKAPGKALLNLFCYTASFSVQAALGGARRSISVDLSGNYLEWAERNFNRNRLGPAHICQRADVMDWLGQEPSELFDLVVCDPPTFSNSKRMESHFDVQSRQLELIDGCFHHLKAGGELFFSTNFRKFQLDPRLLARYRFEELTPDSIPPDFRDRKIHRCWRVTRKTLRIGS